MIVGVQDVSSSTGLLKNLCVLSKNPTDLGL